MLFPSVSYVMVNWYEKCGGHFGFVFDFDVFSYLSQVLSSAVYFDEHLIPLVILLLIILLQF